MLTCTIDILQQLLVLDDRVFLFFNGFHSSYFDALMMMLTGKFIWVPLYAAMAAALFMSRRVAAALMLLVGVGLVIAITDYSIASWIRPYFCRLRPSNPDNPVSVMGHVVDGYRGGDYGFPSCHAANSFALAVFMSLVARRRLFTWFIFLWAVLHSYTRLYLGVHYPGDLIVGTLYGSLIGAVIYMLLRLVPFGGKQLIHIDRNETIWIVRPWTWPVVTGVATVAVAAIVAVFIM